MPHYVKRPADDVGLNTSGMTLAVAGRQRIEEHKGSSSGSLLPDVPSSAQERAPDDPLRQGGFYYEFRADIRRNLSASTKTSSGGAAYSAA